MFSAVYAFEQTFKKWQFRSHFPPFWPIFRPRWVKTASFFLNSEDKPIPMRGYVPMFEQTFKKWYFQSQNGLLGQKTPKNDFFQQRKKTPAGNIPTFRKTQENNFQDHPGKSQQGKILFIEILARK